METNLDVFVKNHFEPLLRRVAMLEQEAQTTKKEHEAKIRDLEDQIEELHDLVDELQDKIDDAVPVESVAHQELLESQSEDEAEAEQSFARLQIADAQGSGNQDVPEGEQESEEEEEDEEEEDEEEEAGEEDEPWLFSCQHGTPVARLQNTFGFDESLNIDLNAATWKSQENMLMDLVAALHVPIDSEPSPEDPVSHIQRAAFAGLKSACRAEVLVVVRNVDTGASQTAMHNGLNVFAVSLAELVSMAWAELELQEPENLGRVAVIFDGHNIPRQYVIETEGDGPVKMLLNIEPL